MGAIEFSVRYEELQLLSNDLEPLRSIEIDLAPLAPELSRLIIEENRRARLAGEDTLGGYLVEVRDPNDPRRGGTGPPLAPKGDASRVISNFFVRETRAGINVLEMQAGWTGIEFLVAHAAGSGHLPVRDILGGTPESDQFLDDVIRDYVDRRLDEMLDQIWSGR